VEALQQLGDHQSVVRELSECLILDPDNPATHYNLGVALLRSGSERERAAGEFRRALAIDPGYDQARNALRILR
jgi:Flp pilus assembly protein TadD